jgi:hypothetical protein
VIPILWRYRRLAAYGIAGAAIIGGLLWYRASLISAGEAIGEARVQARWALAVEASNAAVKAKDEAYQRTLAERDAALAQVAAALSRPLPDPKTLIVRVPSDAPDCTCADRSPDFRLRYNEIAAGTASR